MTETLTGGCRCGAIRYSVSGPPKRASLCHCRDCQRSAGAPAVAWFLVVETSLSVEGEPRTYESSLGTTRQFCGRCGTGLFYRNADIFPGGVDVQLATLDHPERIAVTEQVQTADRLRWMGHLDTLPAHGGYPPE